SSSRSIRVKAGFDTCHCKNHYRIVSIKPVCFRGIYEKINNASLYLLARITVTSTVTRKTPWGVVDGDVVVTI
ncbi:hypothetical protein QSI21_23965, partial [Enterobacter hormaechei]|uniref:hypothetical protein n=1 Tax=Enterobacter hormaechei TaxID=158836 RepID=UPI00256F3138